MGNYYSTNQTWYVYSRDLTSESWNKEPIHQAEEEILWIFKHLVYKFALQMDEANKKYKAIYLYQGSTRYIKAELMRPESDDFYKLILDFKNTELAAATLICWPIMLLHNEKNTSFLVINDPSL